MARTRNIKPSFFMHDGIAELAPLTRLLWIGLWTLADRAGRLQDNPKRIKAALFPWDEIDVDAGLEDLSRAGFLVRYEVGGERLLEVPNFEKHQQPHHKEKPSNLPGPVSAPGKPRASTVSAPERVGNKETQVGNKETQVGNKETHYGASPPDPGSLILDPCSPVPGAADDDGQVEAFALATPEPTGPTPEDLRRLWNQHRAPEQPEWRETSAKRAAAAKARLADRPLYGSSDSWEAVVQRIARSSFARGLIAGRDGRTWIANPEWLLRPDSAARTLEGQYDDRTALPAEKSRSADPLARLVPLHDRREIMPWETPR